MRRIDELTSEINEATIQLQNIKDQMSKQFKEIWKLQCKKDMGKEYAKERYDDLMYNHKLLQMKRRQLITHINYLNKEFFEVLMKDLDPKLKVKVLLAKALFKNTFTEHSPPISCQKKKRKRNNTKSVKLQRRYTILSNRSARPT